MGGHPDPVAAEVDPSTRRHVEFVGRLKDPVDREVGRRDDVVRGLEVEPVVALREIVEGDRAGEGAIEFGWTVMIESGGPSHARAVGHVRDEAYRHGLRAPPRVAVANDAPGVDRVCPPVQRAVGVEDVPVARPIDGGLVEAIALAFEIAGSRGGAGRSRGRPLGP